MACNAAELVRADTIRAFERRFAPYGLSAEAITPAYGMAEMVVGVSTRVPGQPLVVDRISRSELTRSGAARQAAAGGEDCLEVVQVGKLFDRHEARIAGPDGEPLGERQQGEIQLRGPSLFAGYFADEPATREVMADGWLRTGDLGYLAEGKLFVSGRAKELIVRGGEKHHPHLIERAAGAITGVRDGCVAAVGVPSPTTGTEDIVVLYETRETSAERLAEMARQVERAVRDATGLALDRLVPVAPNTIPKTSSGKVRRGVIRQRVAHLLQGGAPLERDLLSRAPDAA
jgi:acyl-CoA synthetase (AMP-forming)/AMP-acid ligase II